VSYIFCTNFELNVIMTRKFHYLALLLSFLILMISITSCNDFVSDELASEAEKTGSSSSEKKDGKKNSESTKNSTQKISSNKLDPAKTTEDLVDKLKNKPACHAQIRILVEALDEETLGKAIDTNILNEFVKGITIGSKDNLSTILDAMEKHNEKAFAPENCNKDLLETMVYMVGKKPDHYENMTKLIRIYELYNKQGLSDCAKKIISSQSNRKKAGKLSNIIIDELKKFVIKSDENNQKKTIVKNNNTKPKQGIPEIVKPNKKEDLEIPAINEFLSEENSPVFNDKKVEDGKSSDLSIESKNNVASTKPEKLESKDKSTDKNAGENYDKKELDKKNKNAEPKEYTVKLNKLLDLIKSNPKSKTKIPDKISEPDEKFLGESLKMEHIEEHISKSNASSRESVGKMLNLMITHNPSVFDNKKMANKLLSTMITKMPKTNPKYNARDLTINFKNFLNFVEERYPKTFPNYDAILKSLEILSGEEKITNKQYKEQRNLLMKNI